MIMLDMSNRYYSLVTWGKHYRYTMASRCVLKPESVQFAKSVKICYYVCAYAGVIASECRVIITWKPAEHWCVSSYEGIILDNQIGPLEFDALKAVLENAIAKLNSNGILVIRQKLGSTSTYQSKYSICDRRIFEDESKYNVARYTQLFDQFVVKHGKDSYTGLNTIYAASLMGSTQVSFLSTCLTYCEVSGIVIPIQDETKLEWLVLDIEACGEQCYQFRSFSRHKSIHRWRNIDVWIRIR